MALVCIKGTRECSGCGKCIQYSACTVCGNIISDGMKYYEVSQGLICSQCTEKDFAMGLSVCFVCRSRLKKGDALLHTGIVDICAACGKEKTRIMGYL